MKILAPISNVDEIESIVNLDIDEVYTGINIGKFNLTNRRPSSLCNFSSLGDFEKLINRCHENDVKVNLVLNALFYPEDCFKDIFNIICKLKSIGLDNIIISDLNLLLFLEQNGVNKGLGIHASTCCSLYNSMAVKVFQDLGVNRIILPRHLTIDEIKNIVSSNYDMSYEVLIKNTRCINDDGMCSFEHGLHNFGNKKYEGGGCRLNYETSFERVSNELSEIDKKIILSRMKQVRGDFLFSCGACSLYEFSKLHIDVVKIVGREFSIKRKIKDIKFISMLISKLESNSLSKNEYSSFAKALYVEIYGQECTESQCYY